MKDIGFAFSSDLPDSVSIQNREFHLNLNQKSVSNVHPKEYKSTLGCFPIIIS